MRGLGEIENFQAPVPESDIAFDTDTTPVRTAMPERIRQTIERCRINRMALQIDDAGYTAHDPSIARNECCDRKESPYEWLVVSG